VNASPRILVTCDRHLQGVSTVPGRPFRPDIFLYQAYFDAVFRSGGLPLLVAPFPDQADEAVAALLPLVHGVLVTGGAADIPPDMYGEAERVPFPALDRARARTELAIAGRCMAEGIPILGVCGGLQVLAVAAGGTLVQDIETERPDALVHQQPSPSSEPWHEVRLEGSLLLGLYGATTIRTNSTHHQAVATPGRFRVAGRASDGVVEAIELLDHPFCLGVQWHPESLGSEAGENRLVCVEALVAAARRRMEATGTTAR
jgi:putative glutamine amidotransferase